MRKQRKKFPEIASKIIDESDIILEILDSRFITETRNFKIEEEILKRGKKIIFVLNKKDLIDYKRIEKSILSELYPYTFVSCTTRDGIKDLRNKIKQLSKKIIYPINSDKLGRVCVGVIGYPNVGKSSLINLLIGKSSAGTGAEPGFTKGVQKLKLSQNIVLLDSPGVIPKDEYSHTDNKSVTKHTKLSARAYSQVKNPEIILHNLMDEFPGVFEKFYSINAEGDSEMLIEKLGRKKGFLKKGNEVNDDKTARNIIKDWQEGRIRV